ncbi:MAG: DUF2516 family protein [Pseudonocardiaceae bacterium]
MLLPQDLDQLIYWILYWAAVPVGLYALAHAALQRADAYTAADKLTKPAWVGITGGGAALLLLNVFAGPLLLFYLIALVAVLIYIVDVKPAVTEIQRGPHW